MDYEKKYNEALERFKAFKEKYYTKNTVIGDAIFDKTGEMQRDFESIFQEFRESEDERIRKAIVHLLEVASEAYLIEATGFKKEQFLSYLEKQKEQKPAEWSEEDEKTINDACCWIAEYAGYLMDKNYGKASMLMGLTEKLKSLRPSWKPSEEQMKALDKVVNGEVLLTTQHKCLESLYEHLKKLM